MKEKDRFGRIPLVIGLAFLAFGLFSITDTLSSLVSRTIKTEGTVVGVKWKTVSLEHSDQAFPIVRFVTESGRTIEFTSNTGGGGHREGESVPVRYDPADPTDAKIDEFYNLWFLPVVFLGVGGIIIFSDIRRRVKSPGAPEPEASQNG